ncbi:MAG: hypothetical protein GQF41_0515 [Candidatus Rifleibacterium amylolyticum]|nr:MAG: hypothetical protein GQF41_0515 [Candidatus Rifleibacterium amylolyticum]
MKTGEIVKEIEKLGLAEKLILVEDIWDAIARENSAVPLPEWQKNELDKRQADYNSDRLMLHDWQSVHEELREKFK